MLRNACGKELGQFSSKEVAVMLFCSQYTKNCRKLLDNGQGLGVDAIQFGRATEEARGDFGKTPQIGNKILMEQEMPAWERWCRLSEPVITRQTRRWINGSEIEGQKCGGNWFQPRDW